MAFERTEGMGGLRVRTVELAEGGKAVDVSLFGEHQEMGTVLTPEQAMSVGLALVKAAHLAAFASPPPEALH